MVSWSEFAAAAPRLSASIRGTIHQFGPGLAFLATVRPDGGPRLHPIAPTVTDTGLYCCLLDTPKRHDLEVDDRYALHAFPSDDSDDEACVRGQARLVSDPRTIRRVARELRAEPEVDWWLYELLIDTAIYVHRVPGADPVQVWTASGRVAHPQPDVVALGAHRLRDDADAHQHCENLAS
jgi:hypothetical protein